MTTIIIAEKPDAAERLALALADGKPKKKASNSGVSYYEFERSGKKHIVVAAVGHLFNLKQTGGKGWTYPIFDVSWEPSFKIRKQSAFTERYFRTLEEFQGSGSDCIVACDYDNEGSVIGYNVLRFILKKEDAKRMLFSTLTKPDLVKAYEAASPHLDWQNIEAGIARHTLDFFYGINSSRALTLAIKKAAKRFAVLSAGRVQGPVLCLLAEKEKEIQKFVPKPYWQLELKLDVKGQEAIAQHEQEKLWDEGEAKKILSSCKSRKAEVEEVEKRNYRQSPPVPFNITSLQTEAYRFFGFSPQQTLSIAQELYTKAYISYPRTSSEKLPPQIGFREILQALAKNGKYEKICKQLLDLPELKPNEGKRIDPAHESIHPTVEPPKKILAAMQQKIYDLVCRRFFAVFGKDALREAIKVSVLLDGNMFLFGGRRTLEKGWMELYGQYAKFDEIILPTLEKGDTLPIKKLDMLSKQTAPPPRFSQASIIKEMEKRELGTRCLTADTKVKIVNESQIRDIAISELFDENKKVCFDGGDELAANDNKSCFSVSGNNVLQTRFLIASRRRLDENEKVLEIVFEDGSKIKTTEEHPMYVYDNEFQYKIAKELKKGEKIVSTQFFDKSGSVTVAWKEFVSLIDKDSHLYGECNLKSYREKNNLAQYHLVEKLKVTQSCISGCENKDFAPFWFWKFLELEKPKFIRSSDFSFQIKNPFPLRMTSAIVRVLAHLVGDGSIDYRKIEKENCFDFRYHNTNPDLAKQFKNDLKNVFSIDVEIKKAKLREGEKQKYYVKVPSMIGRIIATCFPEVIEKNAASMLPQELYPEFLGALFDDEGHAYKDEPKLFISNTNIKLLEDCKRMLKHYNIVSIINKASDKGRKENWSASYKLYIRGRENIQKFLEIVPFFHTMKKSRLIGILSSKYRFGLETSVIEREKTVYSILTESGLTIDEIIGETGLKLPVIKTALKNLRKYGYVKKKIVGISKQPRKKILYLPARNICNTFYALVNEKVLSPELVTKTIRNIREAQYSGLVYDLTNTVPNFILSNGAVVHNSTRAAVLQTLYDRNYIQDKSLKVTDLGMKVADTLKKYVPDLVDEKLTRKFEKDLEKIMQKKVKKEKVLNHAKKALTQICNEFRENEDKIGKGLADAVMKTQDDRAVLGKCAKCDEGELKVMFSPFSKKSFVGCTSYSRCAVCGFTKKACKCVCPICGGEKGKCACEWKQKIWTPKCQNGYPLPGMASIQKTDKICELCKTPIITVIRKGKRPFRMCLATDCKSKEDWGKDKKFVKKKSVGKKVLVKKKTAKTEI